RRYTYFVGFVIVVVLVHVGYSILGPSHVAQTSCGQDAASSVETYTVGEVSYLLPPTLKPKSPGVHLHLRQSATLEDAHRAYYR
ncbi:hypothetical protein LSH36_432g00020, partial [Paralvinella palmiformis]